MATTENYSSNYTGVQAMPYIAPAVFGARSLSDTDPLVTIHENVPGKLNVTNVDVGGNIVEDRTCDWSPSGTIDKSDTVLTVSPFQTQREMCFDNLYDQWEIMERRGQNIEGWVPTEFLDFVAMRLGKAVSKKMEQLLYIGDSGNANEFDGLLIKLGANDIQISSLTSAIIVAELDKVRQAINDDVYVEDDFSIMLSIADMKKYQIAVQDGDYKNSGPIGQVPQDFRGIPLKVAYGLPENKVIAGRASDLHFGTHMKSDINEFGTKDMREFGESNLRMWAKYDAGTAVTNRTDIILADTTAV